MALVLYVAIVVPFRLGFNSEETLALRVIGYIIDISFFVDIVLTFFTSYYDDQKFIGVETFKDIARRYIKGWFFFDLICVFPFELFIKTQNNVGKRVG